MRVLAVDPGGCIGWVLADTVLYTDGEPKMDIVDWGEASNHKGFLDWTWMMSGPKSIGYPLDVIVCENFFPTGGVKSWQPEALHQIGTLQWMAHHWKREIVMQAPAERKFATPAKLAPYGMVKGKGGHAKSALMHLVTWRWKLASHGR